MPDQIDEIIRREGGATATDDPADSGGRTQYGISEAAHPEAWADGEVTYPEAREIYQKRYLTGPGFERITDLHLQHQLVDMGVPSGPVKAIKTLQQVLGLAPDGVLGPKTLSAIEKYPAGMLFGFPVPGSVLLNLAVRDARVLLYAGIAKANPVKLRFLLGWIKRAMEFK